MEVYDNWIYWICKLKDMEFYLEWVLHSLPLLELIYVHSIWCEMLGSMNHKLESILSRQILTNSVIDDITLMVRDKEAGYAAVHGMSQRVGYDLTTEQQ